MESDTRTNEHIELRVWDDLRVYENRIMRSFDKVALRVGATRDRLIQVVASSTMLIGWLDEDRIEHDYRR